MEIALNDKNLQYSGRIDDTNPEKPVLIFPCSSLSFRFRGTGAAVTVENRRNYWKNYLGIITDGIQTKAVLADQGETRIVLAENLPDGEHEIMLFKRMDGGSHQVVLLKLELFGEGTLLPMTPKPHRRIEVYGDSVSAGEVSEAVAYTGKPDPIHDGEYSNSWYSYSWMTARKLNAQIHDIAQGGIALLTGTGWFAAPNYIGMEDIWDKVQYSPEFGSVTQWDFRRYAPHVVIVAIGQNDSNPEDYMSCDPEGEKACRWRREYKKLIEQIREKYPRALIVLTTTILNHHANWDRAISRVCREVEDEKVVHFLYSQNGCGTPGHIRIPEAEQMSDELAAFLEKMPDSIWED